MTSFPTSTRLGAASVSISDKRTPEPARSVPPIKQVNSDTIFPTTRRERASIGGLEIFSAVSRRERRTFEDLKNPKILLNLNEGDLLELDLNDSRVRGAILDCFRVINGLIEGRDENSLHVNDMPEVLRTFFGIIRAQYISKDSTNESRFRRRIRILTLAFNDFVEAKVFFDFLLEKYHEVPSKKQGARKARQICLDIITQWVVFFWDRDFQGPLETSLTDFLHIEFFSEDSHQEYLEIDHSKLSEFLRIKNSQKVGDSYFSTRFSILHTDVDQRIILNDFRTHQIARALTLSMGGLFEKVNTGELMDANWKKKAKFMAPNVLNLLSFMNATSYWAQFMILECNNLDERTATIRKLIGAAQHCYEKHGDMCSAGAIIMGLNTHNVWSLRFAWKGVDLNSWSSYCRMKNVLLGITMNRSEACKSKHEMLQQGVPYFTWITNELYRSSIDKSKVGGTINEQKFKHIDSIVKIVKKLQDSWPKLEKSIRQRKEEEQRNVAIYQSINQYTVSTPAEERKLGNECDELADQAAEKDTQQQTGGGNLKGMLNFRVPERLYLTSFALLVCADVCARYFVMYFFAADNDPFWLGLSIAFLTISRLVQVGVVYMTKYDEKKPRWSYNGKFLDIIICIIGLGVPNAIRRWFAKQDALAKENQSDRGGRVERRAIPQDIAAKTTIADLEFARLRTAYLVENIAVATLQIYITAIDNTDSIYKWLTFILPISVLVLAVGGYSTFRAVSEPLFRFSDQENILSFLMLMIIVLDYAMRVLPVVFFIVTFDNLSSRFVTCLAVIVWTYGYILFEYFSQLKPQERKWLDLGPIILLGIGLLMTVVADFLPLCRFKFAFFHIEFFVRFVISVAVLIIVNIEKCRPILVICLSVAGVGLMTFYYFFYQLSKEWRKYEEEQRMLRRQEQDILFSQRGSTVRSRSNDGDLLRRNITDGTNAINSYDSDGEFEKSIHREIS